MKKYVVIICTVICMLIGSGCESSINKTDNKPVSSEFIIKNSVVPEMDKPFGKFKNVEATADKTSQTINYKDIRAVWISYIDLAPMLTGKSEREFTQAFQTACRNVSELGCNTLYIHVRPFGDAVYTSKIFPFSRYITGFAGRQGSFDPLEIMVNIAHSFKLSVHAWINPLRLETQDSFDEYDDKYLIKQWFESSNGYVCPVSGDKHLWLDPGYSEVRKLIADGAAEIAANYAVDGIHYDDYFYPTTDESFDRSCYYSAKTDKPLTQWRLENISLMVKQIYDAVKAVKSDVQVGVSPQGNIENNYIYLYADVKRWAGEPGFIDYICPQIYFGYNNAVKPFLKTMKDWQEIVACDKVTLTVGLAVYKTIGTDEEFVSGEGIIARQIADVVSSDSCKGFSLYSYNSLFSDDPRANRELYSIKEQIKKFK